MIAYTIRFLWVSTRGYRLCPWRSPYLRWRIETYAGIPAEQINFRIFLREVWKARREFYEFLKWGQQLRKLEETRARAQ